MERREPDFEDERLRYWQAPRSAEHRWSADPTVLDVDLASEHIYESRIYNVRQDLLIDFAVEAMVERPEIPLDQFEALLTGSVDAAFRLLAKQRKSDGLLTYQMVGQFGPSRRVLAHEDLVEEQRYREFVASFEDDAGQVISEPAVIERDQWQAYEEQGRPPTP